MTQIKRDLTSNQKLRIFLSGCLGRMGKVIAGIAAESADLEIVAGSDLKSDPSSLFPVFANPLDCDIEFDVLIDFSNPAVLPSLLQLLKREKKPGIICTTGLDAAQIDMIKTASAEIPLFRSANMSLGINLLSKLARDAAALLYPDFDIEIIEVHHNQKIDAPSGTALLLADAVNDQLDGALEYVYDRSQVRRKRAGNELGMHAIRGGTIVGEHTVLFAGSDEVIELKHTAQSRAVFARGAVAAARFMADRQSGLYSMDDVLAAKFSSKDQ
ncbi:MAG: 4-hydroxy-tetrahydrodipicolinate reductase [Saccharofermentanales bacterium]